ncbi:DUF5305 family protein [Paractinoplanes globisporus]|uniref:DUF5305 family protein n=1 Tax=Paractinoplanes globisporus TaxID=113565 RepID=A0ABW6WL80_9ACTN|nr:DUF5305 family protein [Actinoplanes globisporus]
MAAIILMAAIGAWAISTDRISYVVTRGVSMNPVYHQDDLIFVVRADSYQIGQIAAYHGAVPGLKVLHRIVGGDPETGFVFKGDNNPANDGIKPTAKELIGSPVLLVPKGGKWLRPLLGPTGLGMLSFLFVGGGLATARTRREIPRGRRKKKVKAMARQGGSWTAVLAVAKSINRLPLGPRVLAIVSATAALVGVGLGVLGWMKPIVETHRAGAAPGQSMTFSYSASVPRSAAYDSTTVTSPDPVFRKLAHLVDVRMRYRGHAGTFDVTAELSDSSGWHTIQQLGSAKQFTGNTYDSTVRLDLDEFDRRAKQAATATGIGGSSPVTVTVTARVRASGQADFTAPVAFQLAPLQFVLSDRESLTVDTATAGKTVTVPREVWLLGIRAASARSWALLLMLAAIGGGLVIMLLVRRGTPLRNRQEIERRYPQLLVHVEPMPSPPGKPVVNVDNFPALVKLAEKYGQMILTWRRPDTDDFVVRDEGITYRYRVPLDEPTLQNVELINRPGAGSHRRKASSPSQVS